MRRSTVLILPLSKYSLTRPALLLHTKTNLTAPTHAHLLYNRGARKLTGESLKVVPAEFATLSLTVLLL